MNSLISPEQHFAVAAALFGIAFFGFWAEQKSWGKLVTGAVWAILLAIVASNTGLIPKDAPTYSFVFKFLVPTLIPLFLINANVRQIIAESGRVGVAFILACIATASGSIIGIHVLDLGPKAADLAGIFTATYTGGSVNYAAVIQATGFDDANIISAATAVDNLMSALFLAILALMPASKWLMSKFAERHHTIEPEKGEQKISAVSAFSIASALTFALAVVAISDIIVAFLNYQFTQFDFSRLRYIFITLLAITPATLLPRTMSRLKGGQTIGLVIAFVFFAAIAAGADIFKLIDVAPILLGFALIILLVHFTIVFGGGMLVTKLATKYAKDPGKSPFTLSLPELIIASNAAILGATTAPALAVARGWPALATPGVLAGVAGYIVGTPLGILISTLFA